MGKWVVVPLLVILMFPSSTAYAADFPWSSSKECKAREKKVQQLIDTEKTRRSKYERQYQKAFDQIGDILDKAEKKKYDVALLKADRQVVKEKVAEYKVSQTAYVAALQALKQVSCTEQTIFRTTLKQATRPALELVKEKSIGLSEYLKGPVQEHLDLIKQGKRKS